MARRSRKSLWTTSLQRALGAMTRTSLQVGAKVFKQATDRAVKQAVKQTVKQVARSPAARGGVP